MLNHAPDRIFKVQMADTMLAGDRRLKALADLVRAAGKPLHVVPKSKLDDLSKTLDARHQGVVAMVAPKDLLAIQDLCQKITNLPAGEQAMVLILDEITDPHNLGALIRVAAGAGVTGIVIPKIGSAGFSPVVHRASAGTLDQMDIAVVSNLTEAMKRLKDAGLWIAGASLCEGSIPYDQYDFKGHCGLVLGSEGSGIRRLVAENCDTMVHIPMQESVESLNVSVAGGIILFEALRQRRVAAK